jgi:predicted metal-dependent HD superfamily phosphohydrolase
MISIERWRQLFENLGCNRPSDAQFDNLVSRYSEKHRAYHNLTHINRCLKEFDGVSGRLTNPALVEASIWYHDAIYNTRSDRNEEDSALLAKRDLAALGINTDAVNIIHQLILSTKHNDKPDDPDARYLIDMDISILGASTNAFQKYEHDIREEYKWVPIRLYRKMRSEILQSFITKKTIYYTEFFRHKYEHQARININTVLSLLHTNTS